MSICSGRLSCSLSFSLISRGEALGLRAFLSQRFAPQPAMGLFILYKTHKRADHEPHSWHPTSSPPLPSHPWPWLVPLPQCLKPARAVRSCYATIPNWLAGWLAGWSCLVEEGMRGVKGGCGSEGAGMFFLQSANWLTDVRRSWGWCQGISTLWHSSPFTNKHNTDAHAHWQGAR